MSKAARPRMTRIPFAPPMKSCSMGASLRLGSHHVSTLRLWPGFHNPLASRCDLQARSSRGAAIVPLDLALAERDQPTAADKSDIVHEASAHADVLRSFGSHAHANS